MYRQCIFVLFFFPNILTLEMGGALFLNKLIFSLSKMSLWLNWPSASWEDDENVKSVHEKKIFKLPQCIFAISLFSPLRLNNLESPLPKDSSCRVWLQLFLWFSRRRPLNSLPQNVFLLFRYYLPFEKDRALHLNKLESPVIKTCYCIEPRDNYPLCLRRAAVILKNTDKH